MTDTRAAVCWCRVISVVLISRHPHRVHPLNPPHPHPSRHPHPPPPPSPPQVSPPRADIDKPLQMLVTNIDYDDHKGRIAIGRVTGGTVTKGATVGVMQPDTDIRKARIQELFVFDNFSVSQGEGSAC